MNEVMIDGVKFIKENQLKDGMKYQTVRTYSARHVFRVDGQWMYRVENEHVWHKHLNKLYADKYCVKVG